MVDKIDRMVITEVLQIRKAAREARRRLGLEDRDYAGIPIEESLRVAGNEIQPVD